MNFEDLLLSLKDPSGADLAALQQLEALKAELDGSLGVPTQSWRYTNLGTPFSNGPSCITPEWEL